jgi:mannose-6-phosphate isomerase-like protein (cupin superfamily)
MALQARAFTTDLNDRPEYQRLLEGKPQTLGMRSGRVHLEPGQACGQHSTKNQEELLVFLTGQGELLIGKVAYIPPETLHDVRNTGAEPLTYVYCVAPVAG